jgi:uncharacterized membrane protein
MKIQKKDINGNNITGVRKTLTISRPAQDIYNFCRETKNLALVFDPLVKILPLSAKRLHWEYEGPMRYDFHGELALIEDEPGKFLRWETADRNQYHFEVSFAFSPAGVGSGTEVTLTAYYDLPGGEKMFSRAAFLPEIIVLRTLLCLKQYMETGKIPTLTGGSSKREAKTLVRS